jgi:cytochrome c-type biogenesis protein CcmE
MSKAWRVRLGIGLIVVALGYMVDQGVKNFSSYFITVRTFDRQLDAYRDRTVRVQGTLLARTVHYDASRGLLTFVLASGSSRLVVRYQGPLPDERFLNQSAIVRGRLGANQVFDANKLEIQCPNHYVPVERES